MKRALKDEWIRRLRSGDYTQGTGRLVKMISRFELAIKQRLSTADVAEGDYAPTIKANCCLGVLCEAVGLQPVAAPLEGMQYEFDFGMPQAVPMGTKLPYPALDKIGLPSSQQESLIRMNDRLNLDFIQIADWIEANVKTGDDSDLR